MVAELQSTSFYLISIFVSISICQLFAWFAGGFDTSDHSWQYKAQVLVTAYAFGVQILAFIPSILFQTEKLYDFVGSLTYITLTIFSLYLGYNPDFDGDGFPPLGDSTLSTRQKILSLFVIIWASRLGSFLLYRAIKYGDNRFEEIKKSPLAFLNMWTGQGMWIYFTGFCVWTLNTSQESRTQNDLNAADYIGFVIWGLGFVIEVVADFQKLFFKMNPANKGKWIESGLWYYSRHPNYFGEMSLWFGVFISASSVLVGGQWICVISPMFVVWLIYRVSGVPLLEKKADKRYGDDPAYQVYKAQTWELVILPRKSAPGKAIGQQQYIPADGQA